MFPLVLWLTLSLGSVSTLYVMWTQFRNDSNSTLCDTHVYSKSPILKTSYWLV